MSKLLACITCLSSALVQVMVALAEAYREHQGYDEAVKVFDPALTGRLGKLSFEEHLYVIHCNGMTKISEGALALWSRVL